MHVISGFIFRSQYFDSKFCSRNQQLWVQTGKCCIGCIRETCVSRRNGGPYKAPLNPQIPYCAVMIQYVSGGPSIGYICLSKDNNFDLFVEIFVVFFSVCKPANHAGIFLFAKKQSKIQTFGLFDFRKISFTLAIFPTFGLEYFLYSRHSSTFF